MQQYELRYNTGIVLISSYFAERCTHCAKIGSSVNNQSSTTVVNRLLSPNLKNPVTSPLNS